MCYFYNIPVRFIAAQLRNVNRRSCPPRNLFIRATCWLSATAIVLAGCGATAPTKLAHVPLGSWGGDHIHLTVNDANATVQLDCAHGTIDAPLITDRDGRFDVAGTFVQEHGGPIHEGEIPDSHPARYVGRADRSSMTITIRLLDNPQAIGLIGPFAAELGRPPRLVRCL